MRLGNIKIYSGFHFNSTNIIFIAK